MISHPRHWEHLSLTVQHLRLDEISFIDSRLECGRFSDGSTSHLLKLHTTKNMNKGICHTGSAWHISWKHLDVFSKTYPQCKHIIVYRYRMYMYIYIYKCINLAFTISNNESFPYFHQKFLKLCCQKGSTKWDCDIVLRWWIPGSYLGLLLRKQKMTEDDSRYILLLEMVDHLEFCFCHLSVYTKGHMNLCLTIQWFFQ